MKSAISLALALLATSASATPLLGRGEEHDISKRATEGIHLTNCDGVGKYSIVAVSCIS
jgi:hypothetical protein